MKCKTCKKQLTDRNKSGYCVKCYTKTPFWRKYQAGKQKEWYAKPKNKKKVRDYMNKPKNKARGKKYQKKWHSENIERVRELKREWAKKKRLSLGMIPRK